MKTIRSDQSVHATHVSVSCAAHARKSIHGTHTRVMHRLSDSNGTATVANHTPEYPNKMPCHNIFSSVYLNGDYYLRPYLSVEPELIVTRLFMLYDLYKRRGPPRFPQTGDFYYHVSLFFFCVK